MESLNTSTLDRGFTLIEVIVVIGLLGMIAALGMFISFDFYKNYSFRSERTTIVSVLQKARSLSMNNINEKRHGVHFQYNPQAYIIFECSDCNSYSGNSTSDQVISAAYNTVISTPTGTFDVIFDQLSGDCITLNCATTPLTISVSSDAKSYNLVINGKGQIDF